MEIQHSYTVVAPSLIVDDITSEQERAIYLMVKNYPDGVFSPRITSRIEGFVIFVIFWALKKKNTSLNFFNIRFFFSMYYSLKFFRRIFVYE